ncbi:cupin domain-containing protein [Duganella radicis]|uniref:Cupin domain-containing protein n=1 Tax=Duganella radicis TaxID=551988 RepID=A0A6L6PDN6_9BURK|nr:cupin domain-containing protein [Duganella radicis]MTV37023.1 cupin domain-containing protein [Duganella radicis]
MKIRRIVTGHDGQGASIFALDAPAPRASVIPAIAGHAFAQVWATGPGASVPWNGADPTLGGGSLLPAAGGSSLLVVAFPPAEVFMRPDFDGAAAGAQLAAAAPGLIDTFEADHPGMHTTDSVDYGFVLDGEIWLELDHGEEKLVRPGDIVVQNGTRHAWRNKTDKPVTVAFVLVGAQRT